MTIVGEDKLPKEFRVAPDGSVDLPYIHRVQVAGLEPQEIADLVRKKLVEGEMLRDPSVAVDVKEYNSKRVVVLGQVQKPGSFPLTPRLYAHSGDFAGRRVQLHRQPRPGEPDAQEGQTGSYHRLSADAIPTARSPIYRCNRATPSWSRDRYDRGGRGIAERQRDAGQGVVTAPSLASGIGPPAASASEMRDSVPGDRLNRQGPFCRNQRPAPAEIHTGLAPLGSTELLA